MDFLQPVSYGEIRYIAGIITEIQDISGGYLVWLMYSACMMW